ncbi:MAG: Pyridoxamine 5'-phosphate oxidase [Chloroflexi bacterium]|jgi:PPOX class probable F420-dependent enzyme|nr:MAG: Pyridoxamine 5'-phosphate oxidase [Chloroflexota bacterium]
MAISSSEAEHFLTHNHDAVLSTIRSNGATQLSVVTVGFYKGGAIFTTTKARAKFVNLNRTPECSLLISNSNWKPYLVLEGKALIFSTDTTEPNILKGILRTAYRSAAGKEHPNWSDYDEAMKKDDRVAIFVSGENIYGTIEN